MTILHPRPHSAFLAALLAPIGLDAEQAASPAYLRTLRDDMRRYWFDAMRLVNIAKALRDVSDLRRIGMLSFDPNAEEEHFKACDRQMRLPAYGVAAIRWKEQTRLYREGWREWDAIIADDWERMAQWKAAGLPNCDPRKKGAR